MTEQTALVAQQNGAAPALVTHNPNGVPIGLEDVAEDTFGLPRLMIIQTAEQQKELGAQLGQLFLTATQEAAPIIDAIIMGVTKSRAWLLPYKPGVEQEPICRSSTFKTPDQKFIDSGSAPCSTCAACPKAQWVNDQAPECSESYNFAGMTKDDVPFVFSLRKTAVKAAKAFLQAFVWAKKPTFSCITRISVKSEGNYFVPSLVAIKSESVPIEKQSQIADALPGVMERLRHTHEEADPTAPHEAPPPPPTANVTSAPVAPPPPPAAAPVAPTPPPAAAQVATPAPARAAEFQNPTGPVLDVNGNELF